jgi:hypothetical protein
MEKFASHPIKVARSYDFFSGTFFPSLRASDKPIAIACLRLVTFLPLRPLFSLPCFIAFISRSTSLPADGLYFREELDFFELLFFAGVFFEEDFFADFCVAFLVAIVNSPFRIGGFHPEDELHQQSQSLRIIVSLALASTLRLQSPRPTLPRQSIPTSSSVSTIVFSLTHHPARPNALPEDPQPAPES